MIARTDTEVVLAIACSSLFSIGTDAINFVTVGDWGAAQSDASDRETMNSVALSLAQYGETMSPSFVLSLGDNFCKSFFRFLRPFSPQRYSLESNSNESAVFFF